MDLADVDDGASDTNTDSPPIIDDEDDGTGPDDEEAPIDTDADDDADDDTDTDDGTGLLGTVLDPPLAPPMFEVVAADGTPRTPDWFTGDPSVVWFFRDTGST